MSQQSARRPTRSSVAHSLALFLLFSFFLENPMLALGSPGNFRPIAEWSGRLLLPTENLDLSTPTGNPMERRRDGSVPIQVENAPDAYAELRGKLLRLRWETPWRNALTADVRFSFLASTAEKRAGALLPRRLDGWQSVSPLEGLAGTMKSDSFQVSLEEVLVTSDEYGNTVLEVSSAPTRIAGIEKALVTFLSTSETVRMARVQHYQFAAGGFGGDEENLFFPRFSPLPNAKLPATILRDIEKSPENKHGWYIYGHHNSDGLFVVDAMEPRSLGEISATREIVQDKDVRTFLRTGIFDEQKNRIGHLDRIRLGKSDFSNLHEGERLLLIHSNVMASGPKGRWPETLPITSGHISFGIAKVVRDAFTNELRFDLTYQQVYCHNPDPHFSTRVAWHVFSGSIEAGWMNGNTVFDALVRWPQASEDIIAGKPNSSFLDVLSDRVEQMMTLYRIGHGTGITMITAGTSCSEDSAAALYASMNDAEEVCQQQFSPGCAALNQFSKLRGLISPWKTKTQRWEVFTKNPGRLFERPISRPNPMVPQLPNLQLLLRNLSTPFLQPSSLLPADMYLAMLRQFLENGAGVTVVRAVFVGGNPEGLRPMNPMQFLSLF